MFMKTLNRIFLTLFAVAVFFTATAQVPKLSSHTSAPATIFLDFDGQTVTGSAWNWSGPIYAEAATLSIPAITEIFNRVAEDFRPFNINVTTDSAYFWSVPANKRTRIIVTPTSAWYGLAGGVAYVGSFAWGDNTPAWVFSTLLNNNIKYVAEAISHEVGHTLGLQHQSAYDASCNKTYEYYGGTGSGEIGWAPIMGVGYYQNLTSWHNGTNSISCGTYQSDFDIIASAGNGFGLRTDDHANTTATATTINLSGGLFTASGLVNNATDVDVFKLTVGTTSNLTLNVIPQNVGSSNAGANVDIKIVLMKDADSVDFYNPSTLLNAGVDTNITAGTYYLVIDGVGNANQDNYGSLGLFTVSGTLNATLPVFNFKLNGTVNNGQHQLNWSFLADEPLQLLQLEQSTDARTFTTVSNLPIAARSYQHTPSATNEIIYYRLKAVTAQTNRTYYTNTLSLKNNKAAVVTIKTQAGANAINIVSNGQYAYQLLAIGGQQIAAGTINKGSNQLNTNGAKGVLVLRYSNGSQLYTQKIIQQ